MITLSEDGRPAAGSHQYVGGEHVDLLSRARPEPNNSRVRLLLTSRLRFPSSASQPPSLPATDSSQLASQHVQHLPTNFRGLSRHFQVPTLADQPPAHTGSHSSLSLSLLEIEMHWATGTHLDFPCGVRPQHAGFLGPSAHVRRRGARQPTPTPLSAS